MGELATITHEGTEITVSMIKWGAFRRMALSRMHINPDAPARFVPQYEIAIYKGSPKAVVSSKPVYVFYYPDRDVAFEKWLELTANLKSCGLHGKEMQAFIRDGNPEKQGFLAMRAAEFKKLREELQAAITAEALHFSCDVKSKYEGKMGGQLNQMLLNLGALSFFVYALSQVSYRRHGEVLRETIYDPTMLELSRLHGKMIGALTPARASGAEEFVLDHLNIRGMRYYTGSSSFLGQSVEDKESALWVAACAISEDVGHPKDIFLPLIIKIELMRGIKNLNLAQRVKAMEELKPECLAINQEAA